MENDKWKMLFARNGKSKIIVTLLFIIFHLSFVIFKTADLAGSALKFCLSIDP